MKIFLNFISNPTFVSEKFILFCSKERTDLMQHNSCFVLKFILLFYTLHFDVKVYFTILTFEILFWTFLLFIFSFKNRIYDKNHGRICQSLQLTKMLMQSYDYLCQIYTLFLKCIFHIQCIVPILIVSISRKISVRSIKIVFLFLGKKI